MATTTVTGAASPKPPSSSPKGRAATLQYLMLMHKQNLFTREEVRAMVFKEMEKEPSPKADIERETKVPPLSPKIEERSPDQKPTAAAKTRKTADEDTTDLRDIVKNPTRRRFFAECVKPVSPLWKVSPAGKAALNRILFDRASVDPIDIMFKKHPNALRKISQKRLERQVHWQVMRDRNNYGAAGRKPKRAAFFGPPLPFDFEAEQAKIEEAIANSHDLCESEDEEIETPKIKAFRTKPKEEPGKKVKTNSYKEIAPCMTCRVSCWLGAATDCPAGTLVAYPLNSDWETFKNVQPYCKKCWADENSILRKLGSMHRRTGTKHPKTKRKKFTVDSEGNIENPDQSTPKNPRKKTKAPAKKTKAPAKKTKAPAKKTKAPAKKKEKVVPWKVRTVLLYCPVIYKCFSTLPINNVDACSQVGQRINGRHPNGKMYGAYISEVNADGTYQLYFPEDPDTIGDKVQHKHIKMPFLSDRQKNFSTWDKYVGKVFYDPGTKPEDIESDDEETEPFEAGEFAVDKVVPGNNYSCHRVGTDETGLIFDIGYVIKSVRQYEEE